MTEDAALDFVLRPASATAPRAACSIVDGRTRARRSPGRIARGEQVNDVQPGDRPLPRDQQVSAVYRDSSTTRSEIAHPIDLVQQVLPASIALHRDAKVAFGEVRPADIARRVLDVGLVELLVHVVAEGQVVPGHVPAVDLADHVDLARRRLEQEDRARSHSWDAMASIAFSHGVLVGEAGDLLGLDRGSGLAHFLQQGDALARERYRTTWLKALDDPAVGSRRSPPEISGIWASMALACSSRTPSLARTGAPLCD